jgi:hypothetical protein
LTNPFKGADMKCNIGHTDRVLRMTVGITLMGLAAFGITGPWAWIGIIPLMTGFIVSCPAYSLLDINTAQKQVGE